MLRNKPVYRNFINSLTLKECVDFVKEYQRDCIGEVGKSLIKKFNTFYNSDIEDEIVMEILIDEINIKLANEYVRQDNNKPKIVVVKRQHYSSIMDIVGELNIFGNSILYAEERVNKVPRLCSYYKEM